METGSIFQGHSCSRTVYIQVARRREGFIRKDAKHLESIQKAYP